MGFRFRKSIRIAPGVRVNVGKRGVSSVSIGRRGLTTSIGRRGVRHTVGIPGSGLSYTTRGCGNCSLIALLGVAIVGVVCIPLRRG